MALNFPDTPANGALYTAGGLTWQYDGAKWIPASGAAAFLPLSGGTLTGDLQTTTVEASGLLTPGAGIEGILDGSSAAAGVIGEYKTQSMSGGSIGVSGTWVNLTYLDLTPGDWDIYGYSQGVPQAGPLSYWQTGLGTAGNNAAYAMTLIHSLMTGTTFTVPLSHARVIGAGTSRVYLNGLGGFGAGCTGVISIAGRIDARRAR